MNYFPFFPYTLLAFGIAALIWLICIFKFFKTDNLYKIDRIPRNFIFGSIFAVIDIAWCVPQAIPIFGVKDATGIILLAVVCIIIGCGFLDYLFARALAGFFILLAHFFLWQSFAADISFMWLFSILCYAMGTFGIVIGAVPHIFRDLLRKICRDNKFKMYFSLLLVLYAIVNIYLGIALIVSG
ncbi:MAG TPA: hypothetical protein QF753_01850 [Victivallales bacterium]|nr:hypothetical protein [Victivallales bacterium]